MTKKTTINKIVSSKAFWIIISLLASFLLWTYIMSTEETTIEMTFSNVKVVYQGADDLRATRGLIVTGADADTVSVRLKGTRRVLGNLSGPVGGHRRVRHLAGARNAGELFAAVSDQCR